MTSKPRKKRTKPEHQNERQQAFIREFAICCDLEQAQIAVGYKPDHGNARRILNDPRAAALLKQHTKKAAELAEIHLAWTLANLKKIAGVNIHNVLVFDEAGAFQGVDLKKLTPEQTYAIEEIGFDAAGRPKIKFANKTVANVRLMDHLSPEAPQRVRIEGPSGGPVEVIDGLGARLNAARQRAKQRGQAA